MPEACAGTSSALADHIEVRLTLSHSVRPSHKGRRRRLPTPGRADESAAEGITLFDSTALQTSFPSLFPDDHIDGAEAEAITRNDSDDVVPSHGFAQPSWEQQVVPTPQDSPPQQQLTPETQRSQPQSYLSVSGCMQMFANVEGESDQGGPLQVSDTHIESTHQLPRQNTSSDPSHVDLDTIDDGLQQAHLEAFLEDAFTFCPVIDRDTYDAEPCLQESLLLKHALALCSNQIRPSLISHTSSLQHYQRAKELFYNNKEANPLVTIIALMLFYWFSIDPPNIVTVDNTSWWNGLAIRVSQQIGLFNESVTQGPFLQSESPGLRRRIWWTLVVSCTNSPLASSISQALIQARERITALSQGRPCLINLDDCHVPMPTVDDFRHPSDIRAAIFIQWVPLCELIGRIGDMLRRKSDDGLLSAVGFAHELTAWVTSVPPRLQPGISQRRTTNFHRDIHTLHLTYLATITLIHFTHDTLPIPTASTAAIVAASCTARLFSDFLMRGNISFMAGQSGWYITVAILALLHARRLEKLRPHAEADIRALRTALRAMAQAWQSSKMFEKGIDQLIKNVWQPGCTGVVASPAASAQGGSPLANLSENAGITWRSYFPYISKDTSPLIHQVFDQGDESLINPDFGWDFDMPGFINQLLSDRATVDLDFFNFPQISQE